VILTLDLGTTVTKAALWERDGMVDRAEVVLAVTSAEPGWAEQDPRLWWASVVEACARLRAGDPARLESVEVVGCTGARETFGLFDPSGDPLGPAILWSDSRAGYEAGRGAVSVGAKLDWVVVHRRGDLEASAWILAPRDLVVWRLTGQVVTDPTLASRTGVYERDGRISAEVGAAVAGRLPPLVPSGQVTGALGSAAADALGLRAGVPVVIGAGDRPCEVLGTGATSSRPMVSWGTTANASVPVADPPLDGPSGMVITRAADGGWLLEGGVSAAGSLLAWLGRLCGRSPATLAALAERCPPGARGVTAVPWLGGARAPWWRPEAGAAFLGLADAHGPADLARAVFEAVGRDVQRCLEAMPEGRPPDQRLSELQLAGGGADSPVWVEVLTGCTGLPARRRRSGQAASAGAALLAAAAVGQQWDLDELDPVVARAEPDPDTVGRYAELRPQTERIASTLITLDPPGRS
jgi:xylulokinase